MRGCKIKKPATLQRKAKEKTLKHYVPCSILYKTAPSLVCNSAGITVYKPHEKVSIAGAATVPPTALKFFRLLRLACLLCI